MLPLSVRSLKTVWYELLDFTFTQINSLDEKILRDLTVIFLSIMCRMLTRKTFMASCHNLLPASSCRIFIYRSRSLRQTNAAFLSSIWKSLLKPTDFGSLVCFDYKCRLWSTWIGTASGRWCFAESLLTFSSFSVKPKKKKKSGCTLEQKDKFLSLWIMAQIWETKIWESIATKTVFI